ncbi:aspartyl protease [Gregarina niphandrodes]|uniref:Aspartyl protease n=1 Tax=Gregarina niphandrodes TaxID=110365 RepID=A0A023B4S9_GRENI|nr:aspartyl protease [Gregarina niphandrodes]EZG57180.1 aspartyl protease [Gregarina niphandrodes]|eukprot:XP_011131085.1 aspartyl protease [Gregarina niphandrodes]
MLVNLILPDAMDELLPIEVEDSVDRLLELVKEMTSTPNVELYSGRVQLLPGKTLAECGVNNNDVVKVATQDRFQRLAAVIRQHANPQMTATPSPLPFDPLSSEGQARILEAIRQENIQRNLAEASVTIPESFFKVTMLYVRILVNKVPLHAFVDSGAQASIMSKRAAARCNLSHLIDCRYQGIARGVGEAKIEGRVHKAEIEAAGVLVDAAFTIIDHDSPDLLFGLDLLLRHQCQIDLKKHCLRIADVVELPFLSEGEIIRGPDGTGPDPVTLKD